MINKWFKLFSDWTADHIGKPYIFAAAVLAVLVWAGSGYWLHWSDTWQLIINTGTTISTFLLVFLIQSAQNQETKRIHRKLNKLLKKIEELDEDD